MNHVSDKVFDLALQLYACSDADMHDANTIRSMVEELERENEQLRADLREAMELLRAHGHPPTWLNLGEAADWNTRYGKLLEKHKERP